MFYKINGYKCSHLFVRLISKIGYWNDLPTCVLNEINWSTSSLLSETYLSNAFDTKLPCVVPSKSHKILNERTDSVGTSTTNLVISFEEDCASLTGAVSTAFVATFLVAFVFVSIYVSCLIILIASYFVLLLLNFFIISFYYVI